MIKILFSVTCLEIEVIFRVYDKWTLKTNMWFHKIETYTFYVVLRIVFLQQFRNIWTNESFSNNSEKFKLS
jgi:hypothetical protein